MHVSDTKAISNARRGGSGCVTFDEYEQQREAEGGLSTFHLTVPDVGTSITPEVDPIRVGGGCPVAAEIIKFLVMQGSHHASRLAGITRSLLLELQALACQIPDN